MSEHGGNIYEIERHHKINKNEIIDFSSNINPLGVSALVKKEIIDNLDCITRYPDPDYFELKTSMSAYYNIDFERLIPGNGGTELIFLCARVLKPRNVLIISPTFMEYEIAFSGNGSKINYFRLEERDDFRLDSVKLKHELRKKYDLLVVCNPNNPTGNFIGLEEIEDIVNSCKANNTDVLIDESFIDFIRDSGRLSSVNFINNYPNILILKSLTKYFAIPGLRLGFLVVSDKALWKKLDRSREPWTINALSEIAGINIFKDTEYIEKSRKYITGEKQYLLDNINANSRLKVFESSVNFLLIKLLNNLTADALSRRLINDKILIRNASNFRFLNNKFFRVAVKKREENSYLIRMLELRCAGE
jgi:threonine-phosphate decarboxylase